MARPNVDFRMLLDSGSGILDVFRGGGSMPIETSSFTFPSSILIYLPGACEKKKLTFLLFFQKHKVLSQFALLAPDVDGDGGVHVWEVAGGHVVPPILDQLFGVDVGTKGGPAVLVLVVQLG